MIYMDNAATTKVNDLALKEMLPYFNTYYANPSGGYDFSATASNAIENSRRIVANCLGAGSDEIYFTSGGTEADNWALNGLLEMGKPNHIITTTIEHKAVLNTLENLENKGVRVTYIPVDGDGIVSVKKIENAISKDTKLITVMFANNEIGTIEPIYEIGRMAREYGVVFHTDAVQAFGHVPINVKKMNIDMLSASGHKFGAAKGTGFLYVSDNVKIKPFIFGGGQERDYRSGTENVPGIVGLGAAAKYCCMMLNRNMEKEEKLREYTLNKISERIDGIRINGHRNKRLPGNINISIEGVSGNEIVSILGKEGICISAGSACQAKRKSISHVMEAIDADDEKSYGTIRISLSHENTVRECDIMCDRLGKIVKYLRREK